MILALEDKSWWDSPDSTVDSFNNCDQFTIAWLSLEAPLVFDSANYFGGCSYAMRTPVSSGVLFAATVGVRHAAVPRSNQMRLSVSMEAKHIVPLIRLSMTAY